MGDEPLYWSMPWGFPPQGAPFVGGNAAATKYGGAEIISSAGGSDVGRSPVGGGDVRPPPPQIV